MLLVTGSLPSLGGDDHDKALEMVHVEGACYMAEVLLPVSAFPFRCVFVFVCVGVGVGVMGGVSLFGKKQA